MREIQKISAIQAYKNQENKSQEKPSQYVFTEVSYRRGQLRAVVEPIPANGEMYLLCLNPQEAYDIIHSKKRHGYSLPKIAHEIDRGSK